MSKTQWPATQPSDGETRGGLLCQNGLLHLTNTASEYLCEWGSQSSYVVNTLGDDVAICRTDYPGTENMVVPTVVSGNDTLPITVVDEDSYFQWEGKLTSAQFYVNKAGGSAASNCLWGTSAGDYGNRGPRQLWRRIYGWHGLVEYHVQSSPNFGDARLQRQNRMCIGHDEWRVCLRERSDSAGWHWVYSVV